MKETVTLNRKEQKRLMVLNKVGEGWMGAGAFGSPSQEAFGALQKGGRSSFGTREPGQKPGLTDPVVLNKGSTALDASESIHKGSTFTGRRRHRSAHIAIQPDNLVTGCTSQRNSRDSSLRSE
jgi:hypothetical protein